MRYDSKWRELAIKYIEVKHKLENLKAEEADLKDQLISEAGEAGNAGFGVSVEYRTRKGNIDHARMKADYGIDEEQYRKPDISYPVINATTGD